MESLAANMLRQLWERRARVAFAAGGPETRGVGEGQFVARCLETWWRAMPEMNYREPNLKGSDSMADATMRQSRAACEMMARAEYATDRVFFQRSGTTKAEYVRTRMIDNGHEALTRDSADESWMIPPGESSTPTQPYGVGSDQFLA